MNEIEKILSTEWSEEFVKRMKDAMCVSFYKYGPIAINYGQQLVDLEASIEKRWQKFKDTRNTDFLVDIANLCAIGYRYPQCIGAHYKATDSNESLGLVGMTIKEMETFKNEIY